MNPTIICNDTTKLTNDEWRTQRNIGIGGSDAAAAIGLSDYKSPLQLFYEKTATELPEQKESDALWFGKKLEPIVAERFIETHPEFKVEEVNKILCHPEHKFMIANLDRTVELPDGTKGILELKTANEYSRKNWETEEIPQSYICQVNHYLAVTGAQFAWIAALVGQGHYFETLIKRDDEFIAMMIQEEQKFWDCVQSNTPPEWDGSKASGETLKQLYPTANQEKKIILSTEYENEVKEYLALNEQRKEIEKTVAKIKKLEDAKKQHLWAVMNDAGYAKVGNYEIHKKMIQIGEKVVKAYERPDFRVKRIA